MKRVYKAMCHYLLGVIADALKLLESGDHEAARELLNKACQDAEELADGEAAEAETPT